MTLRHAMAALAGAAIALLGAATHDAHASRGLTPAQRADLRSIAARTWTFYDVDVDPNTSLPRDYVSDVAGSAVRATTPRRPTSRCTSGASSRHATCI